MSVPRRSVASHRAAAGRKRIAATEPGCAAFDFFSGRIGSVLGSRRQVTPLSIISVQQVSNMTALLKVWIRCEDTDEQYWVFQCPVDETTGEPQLDIRAIVLPAIFVHRKLAGNILKVREHEKLLSEQHLEDIQQRSIRTQMFLDALDISVWQARLTSISEKAHEILQPANHAAAKLACHVATGKAEFPLSNRDKIDYLMAVLWPAWEDRNATLVQRALDLERICGALINHDMLRKRASALGLVRRAKKSAFKKRAK